MKLDTRRLPIKVEMHARLRLAEVLLKETENVDMAEDLLSKGVSVFSFLILMFDSSNSEGLI